MCAMIASMYNDDPSDEEWLAMSWRERLSFMAHDFRTNPNARKDALACFVLGAVTVWILAAPFVLPKLRAKWGF
jgi:hypothetical protein